ncbi:hypothetical protein FPZ42_07145 [Mucilaginibacter achroorhodeus]|uniref:Uncharacterized protein n=1 Tax=Mucilaginibacter achroorhodeus TaxID=2599294 RepID=A0A563U624_9SPHI|nr:hypothetical protein [Mucilaginibacter achroorhodeus]TWR26807.1 hypothetical protein FPZ42_07145 [Mucilaginibacter achroorhodeus]
MLKKSLKSLVENSNLNTGDQFEIIHDEKAMDFSGGVSTCQKLEKCLEYTGDCPNLVTCGTFDPVSAS